MITDCPHCESTNVIKRGQRKTKNGTIQVYGCNDCKKRFSSGISDILLDETDALRKANIVLLRNNCVIAEENVKLRLEIKSIQLEKDSQLKVNNDLIDQNARCKQKCELVVNEKNQILREKERRLAACKPVSAHLRNSNWTYRIEDIPGGFKIIDTVMFK